MKIMVAVFFAAIFASSAFAASYEIDSTHTYPTFTIDHLGFSQMPGRFNKTTGTLVLDLEKGTGSVDITIDAASIDTGFKKRDDHLKSPDFFNVIEYPTITFKSTAIKFSEDNKATLSGKLTIMGVTKDVVLDINHIHCGKHPFNPKIEEVCGFNATTALKRSDYGMKFSLPAVGDDVLIGISVEAKR